MKGEQLRTLRDRRIIEDRRFRPERREFDGTIILNASWDRRSAEDRRLNPPPAQDRRSGLERRVN